MSRVVFIGLQQCELETLINVIEVIFTAGEPNAEEDSDEIIKEWKILKRLHKRLVSLYGKDKPRRL